MAVEAAVARARPSASIDRLFYSGMALAILAVVFVGFAPSYYLKGYFQGKPLPWILHAHGAVFTSWILLFAVQATLIAKRRVDLHRRLGVAGAILAAALVAIGLTAARWAVKRDVAAGQEGALSFLAIPFGDMLVFLLLAGAGILYRRQPETHKRLMLLATISILSAAFARWPFSIGAAGPIAFFGLPDLLVATGVVYDVFSRGRVHPAYIWGGLLLFASQPLRLALGQTHAWTTFAKIVIG